MRAMLRAMAIRIKEWGMLAAPGQPAHVRTQGLYGWERVGRALGEGVSELLQGGQKLAGLEKVSSAGELANFSEQLRSISAEVRDELKEGEVKDWDYAWNAAITPRIREAVQGLSAESRKGALELARAYSAQSSIEARRDREVERVSAARGHWEQQVEASVSAGQEEQATRWLEAGRGVFVPEEQMAPRLEEVRSRACRSRWEKRLHASPLETLAEISSMGREKSGLMPVREDERRGLEESCARARRSLQRELATSFSERLRAGEEIESASLELAARAGVLQSSPERAEMLHRTPSVLTRSDWRRWLDARDDGDQGEQEARLAIAAAPLPLEERRSLLARLERTAQVPAADRRTLSNQLFSLYSSGAFGCPSDAEAQRFLLALQDEAAELLAAQGPAAVADWLEARRAGGDNWVCFEADEPRK